MYLPRKDLIATGLVALGGLVYLLWVLDATLPGLDNARVSGAIVLALGFAASASAVVPTFGELLRGSKSYLVVTSLIGTAAFVGGLILLISANETGFTVLIAATAVLWLITTVHHVLLLDRRPAPRHVPTARMTPRHLV
jgi:hypothetical protein